MIHIVTHAGLAWVLGLIFRFIEHFFTITIKHSAIINLHNSLGHALFSSELLYDWRFTANQFVLAPSPLRLTTRIFFQLNTCGYSPCVTFSLMRGWVCRLYLSLDLASVFILMSESRETHDHIVLSQILDSPQPGGQVPVIISHRNRVAQLYPQALGSLSIAFCDSQGYGGGDSNPPPHPAGPVCYALTHEFEVGRMQNTDPIVPPPVSKSWCRAPSGVHDQIFITV
jgi:hypothetical protein